MVVPSRSIGERTPSPLPLVGLLPALHHDTSLTYAITRLDDSGRIYDQATATALDWTPGQRLNITAHKHLLTVHADPDGLHTRSPRGCLTIPAPLRAHCGLRPGDQLLLAAAPAHHTPLIHPITALNTMLLDYHTTHTSTEHANDTHPAAGSAPA
jgi:hypothetical protein